MTSTAFELSSEILNLGFYTGVYNRVTYLSWGILGVETIAHLCPLRLPSMLKGLRVPSSSFRRFCKLCGSFQFCRSVPYLKGQGDFVSRFTMGMTRVIIWLMGVVDLLT